ncbi:MAG: aminoacyl-tRNA hydrolase [Rudaea sp.]
MATPIRLVAGLGNPGRGYAATRHNAGFWFADELAAKLGAAFSHEAKFAGDVARAGELRIVKPTTFMNLSGRPVAQLARFFGIAPEAILVAHDELDLRPGDARLKLGGGVAGHNGLRDIQAALGTAEFWRLRLGIGHPRDSQMPERDVVDYVLKPPSADERTAIDQAIERALASWRDIAAGDMERAMMALHARPRTSTPGPPAPSLGGAG